MTRSRCRASTCRVLVLAVALLPHCKAESSPPSERTEVTCPSADRKFTEEVSSRSQPGGSTAKAALQRYLQDKYSQVPISGLTWTEELLGTFAGRLYEGSEVSAQVTAKKQGDTWVVTKIVACGQDLGAEIPE